MPSLVGRPVGPVGYGTMRMTWTPNPPPQDQCFQTLDKTVSLGGNFWNAGELYGTPEYNSLHLLNAYFTHNPHHADKVVLSIKGGLLPGQLVPDGSEANIRRSVDESLRVLDGKKRIDIFECARQDPNTSIEQTVTVLGELVKEGKIGGIGLSEVDAETVRRAAKVHPIAAVEVEFSLWETSILHNDIARTCAELNVPIVAYSPLGWGVLTGAFATRDHIPEGDLRRHMKKFQEGVFEQNIKLVNGVQAVAARKGVPPVQIALAWITTLSERDDMPTIIPIPGGTTVDKVTQNLQGLPRLSESEMAEIETVLRENQVVGGRY